jgi:hypothetical protein
MIVGSYSGVELAAKAPNVPATGDQAASAAVPAVPAIEN